MNCPACGSGEFRVITGNHGPAWRLRHRRCTACAYQTKTIEVPADHAVAYQAPIGVRAGGSRLAVRPERISTVQHFIDLLSRS